MFHFYTPWKQKTRGFLCFQEVWKWNIGWKWVKMARNLSYLENFDLQQLSAYSDFCWYHFNNDLPKLIQDYVKHLWSTFLQKYLTAKSR